MSSKYAVGESDVLLLGPMVKPVIGLAGGDNFSISNLESSKGTAVNVWKPKERIVGGNGFLKKKTPIFFPGWLGAVIKGRAAVLFTCELAAIARHYPPWL